MVNAALLYHPLAFRGHADQPGALTEQADSPGGAGLGRGQQGVERGLPRDPLAGRAQGERAAGHGGLQAAASPAGALLGPALQGKVRDRSRRGLGPVVDPPAGRERGIDDVPDEQVQHAAARTGVAEELLGASERPRVVVHPHR